jgi:hypothetical protein
MYKLGYLHSPSSFVAFTYSKLKADFVLIPLFSLNFTLYLAHVYCAVETQHTVVHTFSKEMHKVTSSNMQSFFILMLNGVTEMNHLSKLAPTVHCSYQDVTDHAVTILYIHWSNFFYRSPQGKSSMLKSGQHGGQMTGPPQPSHVWGVMLSFWNHKGYIIQKEGKYCFKRISTLD